MERNTHRWTTACCDFVCFFSSFTFSMDKHAFYFLISFASFVCQHTATSSQRQFQSQVRSRLVNTHISRPHRAQFSKRKKRFLFLVLARVEKERISPEIITAEWPFERSGINPKFCVRFELNKRKLRKIQNDRNDATNADHKFAKIEYEF